MTDELITKDGGRYNVLRRWHPRLEIRYWTGQWWEPLYGEKLDKCIDDLEKVSQQTMHQVPLNQNDTTDEETLVAPLSPASAEPAQKELESMTRMFNAACVDLGLINEALGLDPDDGGAEPILSAIEELKSERDKWVDAQYAAPPYTDAKDRERLDFMFANDAFLSRSTADAGVVVYQLMAQDEDEEYTELSGAHVFFPSPRAAIDAAIAAKEAAK